MEFPSEVVQTELQGNSASVEIVTGVIQSEGDVVAPANQSEGDVAVPSVDRSGDDLPVATNPSSESENQSEPSYKIIQVAALLFTGSLALMVAMPGGLNNRGKAVLGNTISFNIFFFLDSFALVASLAVAMINLAFDLKMSKMVARLMEMILLLAALCLVFALMAAGVAVMIPAVKWIVLCFVAAGAMLLLFYIYRAFFRSNQRNLMPQLAVLEISQHRRGQNAV